MRRQDGVLGEGGKLEAMLKRLKRRKGKGKKEKKRKKKEKVHDSISV